MFSRWPTHTTQLDNISRRKVLSLGLATATMALTGQCQATGPSSRSMHQPQGIQLLETRLKLELELDGEVRFTEADGKSTGTAPLKSKATQDYLESIAYRNNQPVAAARHYMAAESQNWVSGKSVPQSLRSDLANIRVVQHDGVWDHFCPDQPMERREVDLLQSPINSLALEKILPVEAARTDSQWLISADDAKDLFNLDAVHRTTLTVKVVGVEKGTAKLEISGNLQATANSVSTELNVRGNAHVVLSSQCAMVSWIGMSIKETREIGEYKPGFALTARIQLVRQELKNKLPITAEQLLTLADKTDRANWLVRLDSRCRFTMLVGRNWMTFLDSGEDAILRYIDRNKSIVQCNIAGLPKLDAGAQLTLEGLQAEIKSSLGKNFEEFLQSSERVTGTNLRMLRVEVAGSQDDVPIHWVYAHLSDDAGRRVALVYTLAAEYAEQFSGNDLQMLDSFEFTSPAESSDTATAAMPQSQPLKK